MRLLQLVFIVGIFLKCALGAKILGVFHLEWGSHYILGTKLMRGLAEAGHDVTLITPRAYKNPPKNGSWTDIVLDGVGEEFTKMLEKTDFFNDGKKNVHERVMMFSNFLLFMANQTLRHPNVQELINSKATFDAVIIEQLMNECHFAFAHYFRCPLIILSSIGPNIMINPKVGNPSPVSTVANFNMHIDDQSREMTFLERIKNLGQIIFLYLFMELYLGSKQNNLLQDAFRDAPDLSDIYYNASLVLLNSHSHTSLTNAVPIVPNMVEIGGYHIDSPQALPKDLQDFLDGATDGAIYFSMGSTLKSKDMPEEKKTLLLDVFGKLKQKVLWKFEEDLPGKPKNILIRNWMPQQDILGHPNIKLFMTHGGQLSTTETIYHAVPVLAIPVFGDQEMNANQILQMGIGLKISFNDKNFNEETLNNLIQELLYNPIYKKKTQDRSRIYHDRPMKPMESAIYWVEYVIRHKGAPHLRVAGVGMPWYKYFMVDVFVVLIGSFLFFVISLKYIFKKLVSVLRNENSKHVKGKTD